MLDIHRCQEEHLTKLIVDDCKVLEHRKIKMNILPIVQSPTIPGKALFELVDTKEVVVCLQI